MVWIYGIERTSLVEETISMYKGTFANGLSLTLFRYTGFYRRSCSSQWHSVPSSYLN